MQKPKRFFLIKPKTLFLIDALGAGASAFNLFVILRAFNAQIGMPELWLVYLSVIALVFCCYSTACYILTDKIWKPYLRITAIANTSYCLLTGILAGIHFQHLSMLGICYFGIEISIILTLALAEFSTIRYFES